MSDTLFLIDPGFDDAAYQGRESLPADQAYYCPYCASLQGVLAMFPELTAKLKVERVPFARPRKPLVDLVGEDNQGLPKLILGKDAPDDLATGRHGEVRFVSEHDAIMRVLSTRYGVPYPHF